MDFSSSLLLPEESSVLMVTSLALVMLAGLAYKTFFQHAANPWQEFVTVDTEEVEVGKPDESSPTNKFSSCTGAIPLGRLLCGSGKELAMDGRADIPEAVAPRIAAANRLPSTRTKGMHWKPC